jgi:hypothetical protein
MKKEFNVCPACGKRGVQRSTVPANAVGFGNAAHVYRCRYCKVWRDAVDVNREAYGERAFEPWQREVEK